MNVAVSLPAGSRRQQGLVCIGKWLDISAIYAICTTIHAPANLEAESPRPVSLNSPSREFTPDGEGKHEALRHVPGHGVYNRPSCQINTTPDPASINLCGIASQNTRMQNRFPYEPVAVLVLAQSPVARPCHAAEDRQLDTKVRHLGYPDSACSDLAAGISVDNAFVTSATASGPISAAASSDPRVA